MFTSIMSAMLTGELKDKYDAFFLMEMDAIPIKAEMLRDPGE